MPRDDLEALLARSSFVQQYGFYLESAEPGMCTLHWPCNERFLRPDGIMSGPVLMAAADTAMWIAIATSLGATGVSAVTTEMKTNFLSPVKMEDFWCMAKVLKMGSRLIFGISECVTKDRRLLAFHTLTYVRPT